MRHTFVDIILLKNIVAQQTAALALAVDIRHPIKRAVAEFIIVREPVL